MRSNAGIGWPLMPRWAAISGTMVRLSTFTPRMWAHSGARSACHGRRPRLSRAFSFGSRRPGLPNVGACWTSCCRFPRLFGFVYVFSGLYKASGASPRCLTLFKHRARRDRAGGDASGLDYFSCSPNFLRTFFLRQDHDRFLYWVLQIAFLSGPRITYRYFPLLRTLQRAKGPVQRRCWWLGAPPTPMCLLRAIESGAVHQNAPGGYPVASVVRIAAKPYAVFPCSAKPDDIESVIADLGGRGTNVKRLVLTPSALAPEAKPETILMRARRLGLVTSRLLRLDEGGEALRLAPVDVEDLLLRPRVKIDYGRLEGFVRNKSIIVTGGGGIHRGGNLRPLVTFGVRPPAGDRELGACPARGTGRCSRPSGRRRGLKAASLMCATAPASSA